MVIAKGASIWVRFSTRQHPAADIDEILESRPVSSCCQLLIAHDGSDRSSPGVKLDSQGWEYSRLRTGIEHMLGPDLVSQDTRGLIAVSEPSLRSELDEQEAVAMTPDGTLHLCVTRDTYFQLGLTGVKTDSGMYQLCVERHATRQRLKLREQLRIHNMSAQILCCTADGRGPSEADLEQHCAPKDMASVVQSTVHLTSRTLDPEQVPLMKMPAEGWARDHLGAEEQSSLFEWLGAAACAAQLGGDPKGADGGVAVYWNELEAPFAGTGQVTCRSWRGLVCSAQVQEVACAAWSVVDSGSAPWAAVVLHGYPHLPASVCRIREKAPPPKQDDGVPSSAEGEDEEDGKPPKEKQQALPSRQSPAETVVIVMLPRGQYIVFASSS